LNDAVSCNVLLAYYFYQLDLQRQQQLAAKTNEDIIKEYFDAMQTEINPSINYVKTNRNTSNKLSQFHNTIQCTRMLLRTK
jgi:hypothetical protein